MTLLKKWKLIFTVTFILASITLGATNRGRKIKRDLLDLADMFEELTELDPTAYIPYGNWCGYGGDGEILDRIDGCCEIHDKCYEKVGETTCSNEKVHIINYQWKRVNDTISCDGNTSKCEKEACMCDRDVVICIHKHNEDYNHEVRYVRFKQAKKSK